MTAEGAFPYFPENHVVPFDLIPDIPSGKQLLQAFFQGRSGRSVRTYVQR